MTDLPREFRRIHLELARETSHPQGSRRIGYDLLAPLDQEGRLSAELWKKHREHCRVRRFTEGQDDTHGRLARRGGGSWFFDFDPARESDDQPGFRLGEERFVPGEYVSVGDEHGAMRTYRVVFVEPV
jgi:hypothetical protein